MSTKSYNVFIGATRHAVELSSDATLAETRTALGSVMADTDNFLYMNDMTRLKTVFWPTSSEDNAYLSGATFPPVESLGNNNELIQIVSTAKESQSLLGMSPSSGYVNDGQYFGVKVSLNQTDQAAIENNKGMFQPVMLENVVSANPDYPVSFQNAVICQKGAIIQFELSCWGAVGFGYQITAEMNTSTDICKDPLYICIGNSGPGMTGGLLQRYNTNAGDTIQIQSNAALGIAKEYNIQYSTVTVKGWSIKSYQQNGTTYSNNTPIPSGPPQMLMADVAVDLAASDGSSPAGGGFQPAPPAGGSDLPGGTTQPAAPTAGPPSDQQFGTIYKVTPGNVPASRSEGLVGAIELFFLVFDSDEDAKTVIKVLNQGDMSFGD